jgi:hypothetical protein
VHGAEEVQGADVQILSCKGADIELQGCRGKWCRYGGVEQGGVEEVKRYRCS